MAIRCAELDIPAAIGCGQQIFDQIKSNTHALLDCASAYLKQQINLKVFNYDSLDNRISWSW